MQEIKIYRIVWKNIIAAIVCLAFAISSVVLLLQGKSNAPGLSAGLLFFGIGGLFLLYLTLRVRLRPYLIITDKTLIQSRAGSGLPDYVIHFAEVDHFELSPFNIFLPLKRDIRVFYKKDKEKQMIFSPIFFGRIAAKLFSGPDEYIAIDGINIKQQQLFDLLNVRVNRVK